MERPDLTGVDEEIVAYIEYLEERLPRSGREGLSPSPQPAEPPTTINVVTISDGGLIKRTPRHFYSPQKRGGMGVFDIELPDEADYPAYLLTADVDDALIILTDFARIFRLPLAQIAEKEVRARGEPLATHLRLHEKEEVAAILSGSGQHLAILTERAYVLTRNKNYLKEGAILFDHRQSGRPVAACWSSGTDDLFVATRRGQAIRFGTRQVPTRGCLAIRLDPDDKLLGLTAVTESSGVLLMGADGKGTIRQMDGFRVNKAPGAGGKVAMNTDELVAAVAIDPADDILAISRLGKLIRFSAAEIPPKSGVVQGVNCMNLRADEVTAVVVTPAAAG